MIDFTRRFGALIFAVDVASTLLLISTLAACNLVDEAQIPPLKIESHNGSGAVYGVPKSNWLDQVTEVSLGATEEAFACAEPASQGLCVDIGTEESRTSVRVDYNALKNWAKSYKIAGDLIVFHTHLASNDRFGELEITTPPSIGDFGTNAELSDLLGKNVHVSMITVGPYGYWGYSAAPGSVYNDFDATRNRKEQFRFLGEFKEELKQSLSYEDALGYIDSKLFALKCMSFEMEYHPR